MRREVAFGIAVFLMIILVPFHVLVARRGVNPVPLFLVLAVSTMGLAFLIQLRLEPVRTAKMRRAALRLGLRFRETGQGLASEAFLGLPLLQRAGVDGIRNVVCEREDEPDLIVFDYTYRTQDRNQFAVRQTVAVVRLADEDAPEFCLRPARWFHRLAGLIGMQDIDFDTHPDFSRRYRLGGKNEVEIRRLFGPAVLDHLSRERCWSIEGADGWLLFYREDRRVAPPKLVEFVARSRELGSLFTS